MNKSGKSQRRFVLAAMLAWMVFAGAGQAQAADSGVSDDKIVLGAVLPLSGPPALLGRAMLLGVRVWAEDVNARGGINGRKIELRTEDDGYVPQRSVQSLKKLIDMDGIFTLITPSGSAQTLAMLPLIDEYKLPTVNTCAISTAHFTPMHKMLFNIGPTYCQALHAGLVQLVKMRNLQKEKFAMVYHDDQSGADAVCGYKRAIRELGLNNAAEVPFKSGTKDLSAEMLSFKRAGVKVVVFQGSTELPLVFKEAVRNDMGITVIGAAPMHLPQTQAAVGEMGDGYFVADHAPPLTDTSVPGVAKFNALAQKYLSADDMKGINRFSLLSYVGSLIMGDSIRRCGKALTRACVVDNLENLKNFSTDGLMPPISTSKTSRHVPTDVLLLRSNFKAGKFERMSDFLPVFADGS